jgi:hypothetical protein
MDPLAANIAMSRNEPTKRSTERVCITASFAWSDEIFRALVLANAIQRGKLKFTTVWKKMPGRADLADG